MMTDDEVLAAANCAHTAHRHVSPTAIRNAGSSIILTDPMLIAAARSCAANVGARQQTARRARAFSFPDAGRERDGRLPATRLPRFAPSSRRV